MIAGLPGTGIGGLFYLLASGWMAFREGWSRLNKRHDLSRSKLVKGQLLLALVIVAGMWAMGESIGRLISLLPASVLNLLLGPHALLHGKYNLYVDFLLDDRHADGSVSCDAQLTFSLKDFWRRRHQASRN